jgi:hypothetical protein
MFEIQAKPSSKVNWISAIVILPKDSEQVNRTIVYRTFESKRIFIDVDFAELVLPITGTFDLGFS